VFGDRRALAFLIVEQLPRDRPAGGRAEQARERRLVLEDAADGPRGGGLRGFDRRAGRGHRHGLGRAAGFGRRVVVVAGVGGDPVVGSDGADRRALGRFAVALAPLFRSVFGDRRALAFLVVEQLPRDRPAGGRAEQARERRLVLEDAADGRSEERRVGKERRAGRGQGHGIGGADRVGGRVAELGYVGRAAVV